MNIKETTEKLLRGCVVRSDSGVNMYTPDGMGHYAALWTRDFAYMVEYAGELIPDEDIKKAIEYLLDGADKNGWIPDRVEKSGRARYTAGGWDFPGLPNLDNGCFLLIAADAYLSGLSRERGNQQFSLWKEKLTGGIECLPKDENGFILNDSTPLHSPYGFTDTVAKSGALCMETLLLWKAEKALMKWLKRVGAPTDALSGSIKSIEDRLTEVFMDKSGMLLAATGQCRQIDIWASCFAVSTGFPLTENERRGIAKWLSENYSTVVQKGQIRHLPHGEYWEKTFVPIEREIYQNGAYWATPSGWFVDAVMEYDKELALNTLREVLAEIEANGAYECINGEYRKLDTYVASAANVYGAWKKYKNEI